MRRVALPDAFFTIDGLFQTFLTVLDDMGFYPAVIQRELKEKAVQAYAKQLQAKTGLPAAALVNCQLSGNRIIVVGPDRQ